MNAPLPPAIAAPAGGPARSAGAALPPPPSDLLADQLQDAVARVTPQGIVRYANRAARLLGLRPAQPVPFRTLRTRVAEACAGRVALPDASFHDLEVPGRGRLQLRATLLADPAGVTLLLADTALPARAADAAEAWFDAVHSLLGRQRLTALDALSRAQLVLAGQTESVATAPLDGAATMAEAAAHVDELLRSLSHLGEAALLLQRDRAPQTLDRIAVAPWLRERAQSLGRQLMRVQAVVTVEASGLDEQVLYLRTDWLDAALNQLVGQAIKASVDNRVALHACERDGQVQIEVRFAPSAAALARLATAAAHAADAAADSPPAEPALLHFAFVRALIERLGGQVAFGAAATPGAVAVTLLLPAGAPLPAAAQEADLQQAQVYATDVARLFALLGPYHLADGAAAEPPSHG